MAYNRPGGTNFPYPNCDTKGNCYVGRSDVYVVPREDAVGSSSIAHGNVVCPTSD